jgi:hypothetical protein
VRRTCSCLTPPKLEWYRRGGESSERRCPSDIGFDARSCIGLPRTAPQCGETARSARPLSSLLPFRAAARSPLRRFRSAPNTIVHQIQKRCCGTSPERASPPEHLNGESQLSKVEKNGVEAALTV